MQAKEAKAFDLSREPVASRAAYGGTKFGDGCLLYYLQTMQDKALAGEDQS